MKKTNIITTAAIAGAGIAAYFLRNRFKRNKEKNDDHQPAPHARHMTTVFARAKQTVHQTA